MLVIRARARHSQGVIALNSEPAPGGSESKWKQSYGKGRPVLFGAEAARHMLAVLFASLV